MTTTHLLPAVAQQRVDPSFEAAQLARQMVGQLPAVLVAVLVDRAQLGPGHPAGIAERVADQHLVAGCFKQLAQTWRWCWSCRLP